MSKLPFPHVPLAEVSVFRVFTPGGLFRYRHVQALGLLERKDLGGIDVSEEVEEQAIALRRPLAALVMFLNVVALEDFFRDLGSRLADVVDLKVYFPDIGTLARAPVKHSPTRPQARRYRDPVPLFDFDRLNAHYENAIGVAPIPVGHFPKLQDLVLLRHATAHNGSYARTMRRDFSITSLLRIR